MPKQTDSIQSRLWYKLAFSGYDKRGIASNNLWHNRYKNIHELSVLLGEGSYYRESMFLNGTIPVNLYNGLPPLPFQQSSTTLSVTSQLLFSSVYRYLFSEGGDLVYLEETNDPKVRRTTEVGGRLLALAETQLQETIKNDRDFNAVIRTSIKHSIDYGSGFVLRIEDKFVNVHPTSLVCGDISGEDVYIMDFGEDFLVLSTTAGMKNFSDIIGNIQTNQKYVFIRYRKEDEKRLETLYSDHPFIFELNLGLSGNTTGCGDLALHAAIREAEFNCITEHAQKNEAIPPVAVDVVAMPNNDCPPQPGNAYNYNSRTGGTPEAAPMTAARGNSATNFLEYWKNAVRAAYFLDVLAGTKETVPDFLANTAPMFYQFFLTDLLNTYVRIGNGKTAFKNSGVNTNDISFRFVSTHSNDKIQKRLAYLKVSQETIAALAQLDPSVAFTLDAQAVARGTLDDVLPSGYLRTQQEVNEIIQKQMELSQQSAGQPQT